MDPFVVVVVVFKGGHCAKMLQPRDSTCRSALFACFFLKKNLLHLAGFVFFIYIYMYVCIYNKRKFAPSPSLLIDFTSDR